MLGDPHPQQSRVPFDKLTAMEVLVLAGGRNPESLMRRTGVTYRAQLPVGAKTMLERVLEGLQGFGPIRIVADFPVPGAQVIPAGQNFVESLSRGLDAIESSHFLLVTADVPDLTPQAVQDFVDKCDRSALINYPLIPLDLANERYPGFKRTSYALSMGRVTGGNIAFVATDLMRKSLPRLQQAYDLRKKVLKLALMIGPGIMMRFLAGLAFPALLTLPKLEQAIGRRLGGPVKAVVTTYPELGHDIDTEEQYDELVRRTT